MLNASIVISDLLGRHAAAAEHAGDAGRFHSGQWRDISSDRVAQELRTSRTKQYFYSTRGTRTRPAGSILIFNSNLWHAGGDNMTNRPRRSVTPMYLQAVHEAAVRLSARRRLRDGRQVAAAYRQVLGYNARVPATLDEWYQPRERRMYRSDQG